MTIYQQYLGQFSLTTLMDNFSLDDGGGADAVTLDTGDYFISGYETETADQLLEHMQVKVRALGAPYTTADFSRSAATGLVTLTFGTGGTVAITWTDAALKTLLGFTGTQSGADEYTATNQAQYCWSPSLSPSQYPGDLPTLWLPDSTSMLSVAPDGKLVGSEGNELFSAAIIYDLLDREEVISDSSTVHESFQEFWNDVIHKVMPVRVYPDKTLNTEDDFVTGRIVPPQADLMGEDAIRIGHLEKYCKRVQPGFQGLWQVGFRMAKEV
jgi:hypothetical protein